ncbi:MAG: histidine--tRNA ligase, partial [Phycisphaerae bacterium]|nr:histidine--tRNA ligase [Phycisphaerae bacterium]
YAGDGGMKQQFKYADRMGIRYAVVAGGNELSRGVVQLKDMAAGAAASAGIASREEWRKGEVSQREVSEAALADELLRLVGQPSA